MINKLVGIFGLLFLVIGAVGYALWVEGITNVGIGNFISIPSFVIVVAFGGLTYAKKERYKFHELWKILKQDLIARLIYLLFSLLRTVWEINTTNDDTIDNYMASPINRLPQNCDNYIEFIGKLLGSKYIYNSNFCIKELLIRILEEEILVQTSWIEKAIYETINY